MITLGTLDILLEDANGNRTIECTKMVTKLDEILQNRNTISTHSYLKENYGATVLKIANGKESLSLSPSYFVLRFEDGEKMTEFMLRFL